MAKKSKFPRIPSVTELLKKDEFIKAIERSSHAFVVKAIRDALEKTRKDIAASGADEFDYDAFLGDFEIALKNHFGSRYGRAINATGIVLHTNLGRAVFAESALNALIENYRGYSVLQTSPETGKRCQRDANIEKMLCELTGAEAATVVNNNAAATMLILNTVGKGKEVICSRGQMVEIGGAFRIPSVMETSGAILKEVGATNKTHLRDYEDAIGEETGALLRVHTSNYRIIGFTSEVPMSELSVLGKKYNLPVVDDLGSGALVPLTKYGYAEDEPLIKDSIKDGADLACFSTDKLIGGPQGGAIVGRKDLIQKIRKNPLARAFRVDKMCLLVLEETLKLFYDLDRLPERHPTYMMLTTPLDSLKSKARKMVKKLQSVKVPFEVSVEEEFSQLGSGSLPGLDFKTWAVGVTTESGEELFDIACKLRTYRIPIFARVGKGKLIIDMRTLQKGEDKEITDAMAEMFGKKE